MGNSVNVVTSIVNSLITNCVVEVSETYTCKYYLCGVIVAKLPHDMVRFTQQRMVRWEIGGVRIQQTLLFVARLARWPRFLVTVKLCHHVVCMNMFRFVQEPNHMPIFFCNPIVLTLELVNPIVLTLELVNPIVKETPQVTA